MTEVNVIKGGYQVISPNPPPNPKAGKWGTAIPSHISTIISIIKSRSRGNTRTQKQ